MASRWPKWLAAIGAGIVFVLGLLFRARAQGKAEGEARGRIAADRDRLREAAKRGDDEAVAREWRRSRR